MKIYSRHLYLFSAAVATRQFLISLQKYQEKSKDVLSLLLPRLCLNRYYLAEGVRIYSQETWVLTVGQNGKSLVEDNIDNFVKYYIECTQVINLGPDKFDIFNAKNPEVWDPQIPKNWHPDNFRITEIPKSQPILSIIPKTTEHFHFVFWGILLNYSIFWGDSWAISQLK